MGVDTGENYISFHQLSAVSYQLSAVSSPRQGCEPRDVMRAESCELIAESCKLTAHIMFNPFQRGTNPYPLVVGMTSVKMGDRLVQIGCAHGGRLGAVAAKVGLSGRAAAIVPDQSSAARARKGAADASSCVNATARPESPTLPAIAARRPPCAHPICATRSPSLTPVMSTTSL